MSDAKRIKLDLLKDIDDDEALEEFNESTAIADVEQQVNSYLSSKLKRVGELKDFWFSHAKLYPDLFKLAQIIFALTPMSSTSESRFSAMSNFLRAKRASSHPATTKKALFIHDNAVELGLKKRKT